MRKTIWIIILTFIILASACNPTQSTTNPTSEVPEVKITESTQQETLPASITTAPQSTPSTPLETKDQPVVQTEAGGKLITYVTVEGIGDIALQVSLPVKSRFTDGAGIVIDVATFFTEVRGFNMDLDVTAIGLIHVAYLWPGKSDPSGAKSEGTYDYGGEDSILALRDVIRFMSGQIPNNEGHYLAELIAITPLTDQVGLYAFSHPGIAAVNVLSLYGDQLPSIGYLIGRENPTIDALSSVELGYWGEDNLPVENPLYRYPDSYSSFDIEIDYSTVRWDPDYTQPGWDYIGRAYLDLNANGVQDGGDFLFGPRIPTMFGKRFYSTDLLQALLDNSALSLDSWPEDLATPTEAADLWPFRESIESYPLLKSKTPDLKVMLVMARRDHVQPSRDKPHIHHAFDGFFHAAGLWTRMNPDQAYVEMIEPEFGAIYNENNANAEPTDWMKIMDWSYPDFRGANRLAPLAAVSEMADRLHEDNWQANLDFPLVEYSTP